MPDAPLSRRARRTFEEEAADRAALADPTRALARGLSTGEVPSTDSETLALSRRDRRRLERLAQPLEAWTAEEEMIATGRIPAMTPERIAEHERTSREKATRAAADAETASQELRMLAASERPKSEPVPVVGQFEPAPESQPLPVVARFEPEPEPETEPTQEPVVDESTPESIGYQPRMVLDAEPLMPVGHVQPTSPSVPEPPQVSEHEPLPALPQLPELPQPTDTPSGSYDLERFRVFNELFPPGSLQAALRDADPFAKPGAPFDGQASTVDSASGAEISASPQPSDGREQSGSSAADEIRRLAAEAMNNIERAARAEAPAQPTSVPLNPVPVVAEASVVDEFASLSSAQRAPAQDAPAVKTTAEEATAQGAPDSASLWEAPSWGEIFTEVATEEDVAPTSAGSEPEPTFDVFGGEPVREQPSPSTPSGGLAPHHATFDTQGQAVSGAIPTQQPWNGHVGQGQVGSPPQGLPMPQFPTPLWAAQPPAPSPIDVNNFKPVSNAPQPDFSGLNQRGPLTASNPASGEYPMPSTATGQFSTVRRPDLPEVGGAKHFQWLHLAVIGALVFVLGVVIYNAAFAK